MGAGQSNYRAAHSTGLVLVGGDDWLPRPWAQVSRFGNVSAASHSWCSAREQMSRDQLSTEGLNAFNRITGFAGFWFLGFWAPQLPPTHTTSHWTLKPQTRLYVIDEEGCEFVGIISCWKSRFLCATIKTEDLHPLYGLCLVGCQLSVLPSCCLMEELLLLPPPLLHSCLLAMRW